MFTANCTTANVNGSESFMFIGARSYQLAYDGSTATQVAFGELAGQSSYCAQLVAR